MRIVIEFDGLPPRIWLRARLIHTPKPWPHAMHCSCGNVNETSAYLPNTCRRCGALLPVALERRGVLLKEIEAGAEAQARRHADIDAEFKRLRKRGPKTGRLKEVK